MISALLTALGISLALTLVLEAGLFLLVGKRNKKDFLLLLLVNVLTNPTVVLTYWLAALYTEWSMVIVIIPLEVFAVLTEGHCYKKYGCDFKRPYIFSIAANIFSYGTGLLIQLFI